MEKIKMKKTYVIGAIIVGLLVVLAIAIGVFSLLKNDEDPTKNNTDNNKQAESRKVKIVDLNSNKRPIAIMINNNHAAWPQSGLSDAFLIYEIMVEGGITRMMALYTQDADVDKIGSVRSSRHNYLDYAMENDAIYIHWGGSEVAYNDLSKLKLDRIDGMVYGNKYFKTDSSLKRSLEHTRFTSTKLLKEGIEKLNFRTTTSNGYLLNYTDEIVDLSKKEGSKAANNITIKYSSYQTSSYVYNEDEKVYYRSMNGEKHTDLVTGDQYKFKNIIAYAVKYNKYGNDAKLKDLQNIGSGEGVYITNGYNVPIKWTKESRSAKTKYTYLDGKEIDVSDGNTFIQIYPTDGSLTIS